MHEKIHLRTFITLIPDTAQVREILARYPLQRGNATCFTNQAPPHAGERWIDVPFAYDPFWERVRRAASASAGAALEDPRQTKG